MSTVTVRIPTPLRSFTDGADEVRVDGTTVDDVLKALGTAHAGLLERVMNPQGELRNFVNVYIGSDNVRSLEGLATPVSDNDVVSIVPAVAGGAGKAKDRRLAELKSSIPEITPAAAVALQHEGAAVIDVREADEVSQGSPVGAYRLGRAYLELRIEDTVPDMDRTVLVMCGGGARSLFAAEAIKQLGYRDVRSVTGGFARWKNDGQPFEVPRMLDADARERYSRHLLMPEVGEAGQLKLIDSKVLMLGAGGLGSPAAFYLAAAGVGTIGVVDDDIVDRSNLQRQILHTDARVGIPKVVSARETLEALNPAVKVIEYHTRLDSSNVEEIFAGFDVIVDGSDNFPTRYLVNDACVKLGIPNVHGAVYRFEGQVSVFWPAYKKRRGPCYRCLYPEPPPAEMAPSCAEAGVLGILPGVVGLLEAVEAIKIVLGIGELLVGRMLYYDALRAQFTELKLQPDPACPYCSEGTQFPGYMDYEQLCAVSNA
ncbi:MAG: molybdopterin-synthase adenylyltransferase MoeB [Gammaproteobacteria bacterium]|nr:MAG: molybdopterin-synthase adenylyltransferase MoeB [Gammaproteobacteria bacterium]